MLDLGNWDFNNSGSVELKGEWNFIWMEDNKEFSLSDNEILNWEIVTLPTSWQEINKPQIGYCWLKLKVILPSLNGLGIYLPNSYSACEVYVNGESILQSGGPGNTRETTIPKDIPVLNYIPDSRIIEIAWKISNFHGRNGGPKDVLEIGLLQELHNNIQQTVIIDAIILGILLMMGLYYILLWFGRKEEKTSIYFAFFGILIFLRMMSTNNIMQILLKDMNIYSILLKIEYLSIPLGWTMFIMYLKELYTEETNKIILRIFQITGLIIALLIILAPSWIFTSFLIYIQIILILVGIWMIFINVLAVKNKREGAIIVLSGFILFFIFVINDILFSQNLFRTSFFAPIGLILFIFCQSIVLSIRNAKAFRTSEYLSANLQKEVKHKTDILTNQKKELETINKKLIKSEQMKELLIESIVHDINNYATVISGDIELFVLKNNKNGIASEKLSPAKTASHDIVSLTSNLLDISKMEEGKMNINLKNINYKEIKNTIMQFSKNLIFIKKQIKFNIIEPDVEFTIKADPYLCKRVLQNLFSNAIKYTPVSGSIELSFDIREKENIICLFNSGEPIPDELKPLLFNKYLTIKKTKSEFSKGLGLFFCNMVMENHHGRIWIKSDNKGNYFYIGFKNVS